MQGRADRSKQAKMWGLLFKMLRRSKKSSGDFRTLTNASCKVYGPIKTKQFWNVLVTDPRLLPIEWHLAAIKESTHQLQKQLDDATHELNQLEEFKSESMDASLELDSFQGMPSVEERTIKFKKLMSEIKDSYHTLAEKVLPHLRTHPQMTEDAKVFGICVKALIGKLTPVVKHLSGVEETKKLVDLFGSKQRSTPPEFYHLHDYISKSCSMLSELIVMMNGLHSKSVDNVNFI